MYRIGRIALYLGVTLVVAGLVVGFTTMFLNRDTSAVGWLGLIPVGFVSLLVGIVGVLLGTPSGKQE